MSGRTDPKKPRRPRPDAAATRPLAVHAHQPAGTKLVRRFFRAKTGEKAKTGSEARKWYRAYQP